MAMNLMTLWEKLLLPLDGKLSPAFLLRRPSLAVKPNPGRITRRCSGPFCFSTSKGIPLPCISIWRAIHHPIMEQSHWAFRKHWSFSFSTLIQKRKCLAHPHAEAKVCTSSGRQRGLPQHPSAL